MKRVIYFALPGHTGINHCRLSPAWGSVSAFVQSAPKYFMVAPFNSIKLYLN